MNKNSFLQWLQGLLAVGISSAASGVALVVADPMTFNMHHGLGKLGEVCGVLFIIHTALYLQKSPLPGVSMGADNGNPQPPVEPAK